MIKGKQLTTSEIYLPTPPFFLTMLRDSLGIDSISEFMISNLKSESTGIHFKNKLLFIILVCQFVEMETRLHKAYSWKLVLSVLSAAQGTCNVLEE